MFFNFLVLASCYASGTVTSALVEWRRVGIIHAKGAADHPGWIIPMSFLWLMLPFVVAGTGKALHFSAQAGLFYQEFPSSLKSPVTGMIALMIVIGFYMSTVVLGLVKKATPWLPDNLNDLQLENVYWMTAIMAMLNFMYFVVCAKMYKFQSIEEKGTAATSSS